MTATNGRKTRSNIEPVVFDLWGRCSTCIPSSAGCDTVFPAPGLEIRLMRRQMQLEFSGRRALLGQHGPFEDATPNAPHYTCRQLGLILDDGHSWLRKTCRAGPN
jgi:hypothetical protein